MFLNYVKKMIIRKVAFDVLYKINRRKIYQKYINGE